MNASGLNRVSRFLAQLAPIGWHALIMRLSDEFDGEDHPQCTHYARLCRWKAVNEALCSLGFAGLTRAKVYLSEIPFIYYQSHFRRRFHCDHLIVKKLLPRFQAAHDLLAPCVERDSRWSAFGPCYWHRLDWESKDLQYMQPQKYTY